MLKGIKIQAILKAFVSAGCLIVIFYLIGKLDFFNRIPKEVAIYRNTPINSLVILGVQGRYYLPVLPLLLIWIVDCTINGLQKIMVANDVKETKTKEKKNFTFRTFKISY